MNVQTQDRRTYPVELEVVVPERYERLQILVRLVIVAALGMFHQSSLGLFGALYLILPGVAAILISRHDAGGFAEDDANWLAKALDWVLAFYAYMMFVTDHFPTDTASRKLRLRIARCGQPTARDALFRLLTDLPHALLLALLALVSSLLSILMAAFVLFTERAPASLISFQRDLLGWLARFFAYHLSLVDVYPPFGSSDSKLTPPGDDLQHLGERTRS